MRCTRFAPVVLGVVLLTSSCGLSFHNLPLETPGQGPTYRLSAVFSDASNLPVGGEVKLGQTTVGRVKDISARDFQAVVEIDVREGVRLPAGTSARLELSSALGEERIVLEPAPGSGENMRAGDTIPSDSTSRGPDVESTLAALGTVLNGSGLEQARTIVSELHTAVGGRDQQIRDLMHRLDAVLATLDQNTAEFDTTINALNQLAADTAANQPVLEAAMTDITPAVRTLMAQREQFEQLLSDFTELSEAADGVVSEAGPAFTQQLDALRPVLDELAAYDERLAGTLQQLQRFEHKLGSAIPGDYLNLDGTLDVSGTVLPLITGGPPPVEPSPPGDVAGLLEGGVR